MPRLKGEGGKVIFPNKDLGKELETSYVGTGKYFLQMLVAPHLFRNGGEFCEHVGYHTVGR